jgi:hypothetical protein
MFSSKLCLLLASFVAIVLLSAVSLIALALAGCGVVHSAPPQANSPAPQGMFVQSKACVRSTTATGYALPCTLDNPVTEGDLLVLAQQGGSNPYDNLGNVWLPVPNNNTFNYVLNAKSGVTTVNTPSGAGPFGGAAFAIIAEYQPVVNIDTFQRPDGTVQPSFSFGSYSNQNLETPPGASWDSGWVPPIYTDNSCDLLISVGFSGSPDYSALHTSRVPTAGAYFTVRESEYGLLALEDSIAPQPGIYIGSISWNTAAHWGETLAAFQTARTPPCGGLAQ